MCKIYTYVNLKDLNSNPNISYVSTIDDNTSTFEMQHNSFCYITDT